MKWYEQKEAVNISKDQYLTLKSGQSCEVIFLGEPYYYYTVFKEKPYTEYTKENKPAEAKAQFRINVYNVNNATVQVLRGGMGVLRTIKENLMECGQDSIYKIKRDGEGLETRWSLFFKAKVTPEQQKVLVDKPLIDLGEPKKKEPVQTELQTGESDDIPF